MLGVSLEYDADAREAFLVAGKEQAGYVWSEDEKLAFLKAASTLSAARKKGLAEIALRSHERLSELIIRNLPVGIAFFDVNLTLLRCNEAYNDLLRRYTPVDPETAVGTHYSSIMPEAWSELEPWINSVIRNKKQREPQ